MNELTTAMSKNEYAALSAEADRLGITADELATNLARTAMNKRFRNLRFRKAMPSKTGVIVPNGKNRASFDPAGGRQHESEESQEIAPSGVTHNR